MKCALFSFIFSGLMTFQSQAENLSMKDFEFLSGLSAQEFLCYGDWKNSVQRES